MWIGLFGCLVLCFVWVFCAVWFGLVVVLLVDFSFGLLFVIGCLLGVFDLGCFVLNALLGWV